MSLGADAYEACLNQVFTLTDGDYRDEFELISVDRLAGAEVAGERKQAFSLVFQSRSDTVLEQRIYTLDNAELGELQIFLVPIGKDEAGVRYEAVFS